MNYRCIYIYMLFFVWVWCVIGLWINFCYILNKMDFSIYFYVLYGKIIEMIYIVIG